MSKQPVQSGGGWRAHHPNKGLPWGSAAASKADVCCPRVGLTICSPMRSPIKRESCSSIRRRFNAKFFGFGPVDVLGFKVMMSDREKTAIDCIDRPGLAGGVGESALILTAASRRFDWPKAVEYLEKINSTALVRRFGWVMDHVKADMIADIRERLIRLAARRRGWGPTRRPRCAGPSAMTRRGACSTCSAKSCARAPGSAGEKR
jgi:hypothetical protein